MVAFSGYHEQSVSLGFSYRASFNTFIIRLDEQGLTWLVGHQDKPPTVVTCCLLRGVYGALCAVGRVLLGIVVAGWHHRDPYPLNVCVQDQTSLRVRA